MPIVGLNAMVEMANGEEVELDGDHFQDAEARLNSLEEGDTFVAGNAGSGAKRWRVIEINETSEARFVEAKCVVGHSYGTTTFYPSNRRTGLVREGAIGSGYYITLDENEDEENEEENETGEDEDETEDEKRVPMNLKDVREGAIFASTRDGRREIEIIRVYERNGKTKINYVLGESEHVRTSNLVLFTISHPNYYLKEAPGEDEDGRKLTEADYREMDDPELIEAALREPEATPNDDYPAFDVLNARACELRKAERKDSRRATTNFEDAARLESDEELRARLQRRADNLEQVAKDILAGRT